MPINALNNVVFVPAARPGDLKGQNAVITHSDFSPIILLVRPDPTDDEVRPEVGRGNLHRVGGMTRGPMFCGVWTQSVICGLLRGCA